MVWTALVGLAALFLGILWLAVSIERMGAPFVITALLCALAIRFSRRQTPDE